MAREGRGRGGKGKKNKQKMHVRDSLKYTDMVDEIKFMYNIRSLHP